MIFRVYDGTNGRSGTRKMRALCPKTGDLEASARVIHMNLVVCAGLKPIQTSFAELIEFDREVRLTHRVSHTRCAIVILTWSSGFSLSDVGVYFGEILIHLAK